MEVLRRAKEEDIDFAVPLIIDSDPTIFGGISFRQKVRNTRKLITTGSPLSMNFFLVYECNSRRVGVCSIYTREDMLSLSSKLCFQELSAAKLLDYQFVRKLLVLRDSMRLVVKSYQVYLGVLSLDRNYRGLGLGRRFLSRVINELKKEIVLDVLKSNRRAIEFYRSNGFSIVTELHKDYPTERNLRVKRSFKPEHQVDPPDEQVLGNVSAFSNIFRGAN